MISAPPVMMQAPVMARPAAVGFSGRTSSSYSSSTTTSTSKRTTFRCAVAVAPPAATASGNMYEVLGLQAGATVREIKAAYRRLALERHPDVAGADDSGDFIRLHAAYATLSDPDARSRYDRGVLAQAFARPPATRSSQCGRGATMIRRTWETDQCW